MKDITIRCFKGNIAEFICRCQTTLYYDWVLELLLTFSRFFPYRTSSGLHVLTLNRRNNICCRQTILSHLRRIYPYPHSIVSPELLYRTYTRNGFNSIHHIVRPIVLEEYIIIGPVWRNQGEDEGHITRGFSGSYANLLYFRWQLSRSPLYPVGYIDRIHIRIGILRKLNGQGIGTIVGGVRGHEIHMLYTNHLVFNNRGHCIVNNLRRCPRIGCGNLYSWRCYLWIPRYR